MARTSDVCVLCCPLNAHTKGIIDEEVMGAMPAGAAYIVNVARGAVVDRKALIRMLRGGHLAGVGMDVYWREPFESSDPDQGGVEDMRRLQREIGANIAMTPHVGGVTDLSRDRMSRVFVENVSETEPLTSFHLSAVKIEGEQWCLSGQAASREQSKREKRRAVLQSEEQGLALHLLCIYLSLVRLVHSS